MFDKHPMAVTLGGFIIVAMLVNFYDDGGITIGALIRGTGGGFIIFLFWGIPVILIVALLMSMFSKNK